MSSMFNIEKLSEDNYESWNLQMKSVLIHQDLWEVISDNDAVEKKSAEWKKKDEKAMATIILCISPVQLSYIKKCKSAKDAWNSLSDIHRPKGPIRKVSLFKQLLNMKMEEDDAVQEYLCQFACVADKLAEAGIELSEDLLVIMILASLPKSFENFVVALESRDELPKLSALKAKLVEENERRKSALGMEDNNPTTAFMVNNKRSPNNNTRRNCDAHQRHPKNNNIRRNYIAQQWSPNNKNTRNHKQNPKNKNSINYDANRQNPNNNTGSRQRGSHTSNNNNVKCYNCGGRGHFAAHCKNAARKGNEHAYTALTAVDNNNVSKNTWCFDTGASSHLCSNPVINHLRSSAELTIIVRRVPEVHHSVVNRIISNQHIPDYRLIVKPECQTAPPSQTAHNPIVNQARRTRPV
ncbi:uncharacterized protein [Musca autumnalis]|uniref:uncharacterized protein n=1 Tax=Musca autumnalis TaxID=221902 RepID=UPI003CFB7F99